MNRLLLLLATVFALCPAAYAMNVKGPFPARDGESCVVCGARLDNNLEAEFLRNPLQYLAKVGSATTVLTAEQSTVVEGNVVWLGVFAAIGLRCGVACAQMVSRACGKSSVEIES